MPFRLLTERIELAAEKHPDRIAFSSQTTSATYAQLLQATLAVGTCAGKLLPRRRLLPGRLARRCRRPCPLNTQSLPGCWGA